MSKERRKRGKLTKTVTYVKLSEKGKEFVEIKLKEFGDNAMSSTLSYIEEVVPIERLKEDEEFKTLVPSNNSREDLEKSLREKSQIFPLITDRNYVLIDGYTRLDIIRKLGLCTG
ncbi:hypothetical protein [Sulfurisphaera ohwakuensis]|uniref:Uncharacterized protein n=1 Tax=Sulfurisphaera ohwakuensis TaxID=69656 RepID=A0A7J9RVY9_SULOH|nr:hypothetical protein [Sulfurisphaera ohwakuensis]MBB5255177.1 hypothetical protein [Sulfurisphaera ohwakuensis]